MGTASVNQFREFAGAIIRSLPDNLDSTVMQGWIENQESLRRILHEALAPNNGKSVNIFTLSIDYNRTVEEGVKAGKYDLSNDDITSGHFPSDEIGTKEVSVELIHFGQDKTTDEVLSELDKKGLRPATLKELLALGEKHPDLQRDFPVIALGSVWLGPYGFRRCACLDRDGSERDLDLSWVDSRWGSDCCFAAVRK